MRGQLSKVIPINHWSGFNRFLEEDRRAPINVHTPRRPGRSRSTRYDWGDIEGFKEDDRLTVYHGFNNWHDALIVSRFGISGQELIGRLYSYENDNNPYGIFVSLDLQTAKKFAQGQGPQVVMEFVVKYSDLEAPVWPGGGWTGQGQKSGAFGGLDKREAQRLAARADASKSDVATIATSDRPELAATLLGSEFQALYVKHLNPNMVKAYWVRPPQKWSDPYKRMSRRQFAREYGATELTRNQMEYAAGGRGLFVKSRNEVGGHHPADAFDPEKFIKGIIKYRKGTRDKAISTIRRSTRIERQANDFARRFLWPKQWNDFFDWVKGLGESRHRYSKYIVEAAKSPQDLPEGWAVKYGIDDEALRVRYKRTGTRVSGELRGVVIAHKMGWPCSDAYVVTSSKVTKGWGPLLYDVAMELASKYGGGLAPDRETVSSEAENVWKYYLKRRPDVKAVQLDDTENYLTPTGDDNCNQGSAEEYGGRWYSKNNPLSKVYVKKRANVMAELKRNGQLIKK